MNLKQPMRFLQKAKKVASEPKRKNVRKAKKVKSGKVSSSAGGAKKVPPLLYINASF